MAELRALVEARPTKFDRYSIPAWAEAVGPILRAIGGTVAFVCAGNCQKEHAINATLPNPGTAVFIDPRLQHTGDAYHAVTLEDYVVTGGQPVDVAVCIHPLIGWRTQDAFMAATNELVKPGGYLLVCGADPLGEDGVPDFRQDVAMKQVAESLNGYFYLFRRLPDQ